MAINLEMFDKLITALRTVDNDGTLDKESTSYNDIFDAFIKKPFSLETLRSIVQEYYQQEIIMVDQPRVSMNN